MLTASAVGAARARGRARASLSWSLHFELRLLFDLVWFGL